MEMHMHVYAFSVCSLNTSCYVYIYGYKDDLFHLLKKEKMDNIGIPRKTVKNEKDIIQVRFMTRHVYNSTRDHPKEHT